MKKCFLASLLILFNVFYLFAGTANKYNFTEDKGSQSHPNGLATGMSFIQNEGQFIDTEQQMRPDILFKGDGGGVDVYLRKTGVSYVLTNIGEIISRVNEQIDALIRAGKLSESGERKKKDELMQEQLLKLNRVDVDFVGCIASSEVVGIDQLEGYNNYYYPYCPKGLTHVKSFNEVVMKNIYKNIDVRYYGGKSQGLKYDIVVNAGGNPDDIKLKYSGVEELQIKNYRLEVKTNINELGEYIPKVYQNIDGKIVDVEARYILSGTVVSFEFGTWNPSYPLVIDPWVTYFGGSNEERGLSVATDKQLSLQEHVVDFCSSRRNDLRSLCLPHRSACFAPRHHVP
ncbi:MAG: hypothetical protein HYU69_14090 [Bacteroidetes bacterium]|nr:hypothetical protein [Bacteroidota bacterium]